MSAHPDPAAADTATPGPRDYLRSLFPGLVAGAADIDPTTVATLAVVAAATVYGLAWLVLLVFPLLATVQVIAARVGHVAGCDLQTCVGRLYGRPLRLLLMMSVLGVNLVTIAADLDAGAAALGLLTGTNYVWYVVPFAALILGFLVKGTYAQVHRVLRYALVGLLAYAISAVLAHPDWVAVARGSLIPQLHWSSDWTSGALALLGTTLTSYVYVWQTIEESEDAAPATWLRARQIGASVGIGFSVAMFWLILVSTGATLGIHHQSVATAQDAAQALRPLAGRFAGDVFAFGLLASALVALPVLAATTAYVVGAEFSWERGLSQPLRAAPRFYAVVASSIVLGALIAAVGADPIEMLFGASVAGGLATPIGLACLLLVSRDRRVMGEHRVTRALAVGGWAAVAAITAASIAYLSQELGGFW